MGRRLAILTAWYPHRGRPQAGVFVQTQAELLARQHEVAVLSLVDEGLQLGMRRLLAGPDVLGADDEDTPSGKVFRQRVPVALPYFPRLHFEASAEAFAAGWKRLLAEWGRPDLVHAHVGWPMGCLALAAARREGVPIVLTEHYSRVPQLLADRFAGPRLRDLYGGVDALLAVGAGQAKQLRAAVPEACPQVVGNVVDTEFFAPTGLPRRPGPWRLFGLGKLVAEKGAHDLLVAAKVLHEQGLSCELRLGGDGPLRAKLKFDARRWGVPCSVLGLLDREGVREEMRRCDVFVHASRGETFGVVLVEAAACGKPVVATRCGGPEGIVTGEVGRLVPQRQPAALAQAVTEVVQGLADWDPAQIRQSVVSRFGPEAFLARLEAVYGAVSAGHSGHNSGRAEVPPT